MKLKELASKLGREFRGNGEVDILMPAPIEAAGPGTIIFVANEKYAPMLETTTASLPDLEMTDSLMLPFWMNSTELYGSTFAA